MRPNRLEDYVGQEHLIGKGALLRQALEHNRLPSLIFWGPPGVGKTTLARLLAHTLERPFQTLSAVNSGVKDVREAIEKARRQHFFDQPGPILFIDEIHRFSKSQQDSLLGAVENGTITLIGATTENPSFEVIPALLSRCQVYVLKSLSRDELIRMLEHALAHDEYLKDQPIRFKEFDSILRYSGGDGRRLYNILELLASVQEGDTPLEVTNERVEKLIQQNFTRYDKGADQHYDIASAFIKSIRGSDPNGAVYWLARMIEGGEDVKFIGRRLMISAAEDIGLANPNALLMATTAFQACQAVGLPEARIILSQVAIYLAGSPKSNSAYRAIKKGQETVQQTGTLPVPLHLRNAPTSLMKDLGYGKDYQYAHDYEGAFTDLEFLPEELTGQTLFEPGDNPAESRMREHLKTLWREKYGY